MLVCIPLPHPSPPCTRDNKLRCTTKNAAAFRSPPYVAHEPSTRTTIILVHSLCFFQLTYIRHLSLEILNVKIFETNCFMWEFHIIHILDRCMFKVCVFHYIYIIFTCVYNEIIKIRACYWISFCRLHNILISVW